MIPVILAIVIGVVLAVGGAVIASNTLTGVSNGTPSNASVYQYGNR
jgi:hypothetical protein